jgi:DEAD/DEAH box helicase domain-containing protein
MKNLIDYLKNTFARNITAEIVLPPEDGDFAPLPNTLNPKLLKVLTDQKLTRLYSHQAEAFESISHDIDTGLVSRMASGKTLSFLLPILNEYANAATPFSTPLLYPTKALSRDQAGTLGKLLQAVDAERKFGTFDGDTPPDQRKILQKNADFVITNPDMLHASEPSEALEVVPVTPPLHRH